MSRGATIALLFLAWILQIKQTRAQEVDLDTLLGVGQQWVQQNIDPQFLQSLPAVDESVAKQWLKRIQDRLEGESFEDLELLKPVALQILPWIEQDESLRPYAPWLRSRLNYFEVAQELNSLHIRPPTGTTHSPLVRRANPSTNAQRVAWDRVIALEPWPEGAKRFVPILKQIFKAEKVPTGLVWLAEIESSFDPKARSPAGAAGLFQLMPTTAKGRGLSLFPFDERYNAEKNTRASAQYLNQLHRQFHDWPLALAAYNAGPSTVQKLIARHRATRFETLAPYLPVETRMYVPKFEAILQRREGRSLLML